MISLGPRMGPSLPEVTTEKSDSKTSALSAFKSQPATGPMKESSVKESEKFSDVLQKQSPKIETPAKRIDTREDDRRDVVRKASSDEQRPESDDSVRNESEPKAPVVAKVNGKVDRQTVNGARKEKAMLKFMDSMESEFGVPPVKIAEALANLKPTDLLKPPEETASQVIKNLDMAPEDESAAMQLYIGFLQQWKQAQSPEASHFFAEASARAIPGGMEQTFVSTAEKRQMLNDSLGRMHDKFFAKDVSAISSQTTHVDPTAQAGTWSDRQMATESMLMRPAGGNFGPSIDESQFPQVLNPEVGPEGLNQFAEADEAASKAIDTSTLEKVRSRPMYAGLAQNLPHKVARGQALDTMAMDRLMQGEQNMDMNPKAMKASEFFKSNHTGAEQFAAAPSAMNPMMQQTTTGREAELSLSDLNAPSMMVNGMGAKGESFRSEMGGKNSEDTSSQGDSNSMLNGKAISGDFFQKPSILGNAGSVTAAAAAGKSQGADPNMQAIMNQAQLVVNRGGGEAVVKLNPEGLGEVRLKVMVINGRVNVEMATQSKEAKQLIENSIGDLRSSLSSHKLAVDHVKVDVGNQAQSDSQSNSQQRNLDARADLGRDQARSFFNQFREDTASRRDPFYEMPGIKAYQQRNEPAPIPAAHGGRIANRYSGEGRGGRMNLVA